MVRPAEKRLLAPGILVTITLLLVAGGPGRAQEIEDAVTLRGVYYREASTRVVQPMIEVTKTLPNGYAVRGHALVDAVSSASIAQGALQDEIFQEQRYEGALGLAKALGSYSLSGFVRYSREPDYYSHTAGLGLSRQVWQNTGTVAVNLAFTHDDIEPPAPLISRDLDMFFAGASYSQVLGPTTLAQVGYDLFVQRGFVGNPFISDPNLGREDLPDQRLRHALALRLAQYFPAAAAGVQLHYRFYLDQEAFGATDPWGLTAHTVEGRLYKSLGPDVEVRLAYRYHRQGSADFWCNARPDNGGDLSCYGMTPSFHSWDVKFGNLATHLPEVKITWELRVLEPVPFLRWFSAGAFELSYGYFFQSTPYGQKFTDKTAPPVIGALPFSRSYGGAHLMQTGYSMPF